MVDPLVLAPAVDDFFRLEARERQAILAALDRLGGWPTVSGVRALRPGNGASYRVRCGGSRILFDVEDGLPIVVRIRHRDQAYEVHPAHRQAKDRRLISR